MTRRRVNLADPDLKFDSEDPPGFRAGMLRPGPGFGAEASGASLYELPPGEAICPYHYEYAEEEWLLVLSGTPSVRTPEGTEQLAPLDLVFFPRGPDGAHQVRNDSAETARVLMWSPIIVPAATAYPDSDKVGIWTGIRSEDVMVERSSSVPYFHGETGG
jgi:uncharacterized cupin superfamily protein